MQNHLQSENDLLCALRTKSVKCKRSRDSCMYCTYVCIYVYIHMYTYTYTYIHIYTYIHVHIYMYITHTNMLVEVCFLHFFHTHMWCICTYCSFVWCSAKIQTKIKSNANSSNTLQHRSTQSAKATQIRAATNCNT